eukprot:SAG22_NODE_9456_length_589_cov_1.613497_1_plen_154_part_01
MLRPVVCFTQGESVPKVDGDCWASRTGQRLPPDHGLNLRLHLGLRLERLLPERPQQPESLLPVQVAGAVGVDFVEDAPLYRHAPSEQSAARDREGRGGGETHRKLSDSGTHTRWQRGVLGWMGWAARKCLFAVRRGEMGGRGHGRTGSSALSRS